MCRPYLYQNGAFSCDIYLFHRLSGEAVSLESILLHELGHVLNVRLTGDVAGAPEDFFAFAEPFFPGLSTEHRDKAPEFFAHCFSMGVASRPELRQYDAFPDIRWEHKRAFDLYMRSILATLPDRAA